MLYSVELMIGEDAAVDETRGWRGGRRQDFICFVEWCRRGEREKEGIGEWSRVQSPESVFPEDEASGAVDYRIAAAKASEDKAGWDPDKSGSESERECITMTHGAEEDGRGGGGGTRCVWDRQAVAAPDGWPEEEGGRARDCWGGGRRGA